MYSNMTAFRAVSLQCETSFIAISHISCCVSCTNRLFALRIASKGHVHTVCLA